jgi:hypothetical protein
MQLRQLQLIVTPDTVLRWHRDLLRRHHAKASRPKRPGRPRIVRSVRALAQVQLCCAHLMRELKPVWESDPVGQAWAEQMRQTLKKARRSVDAAIEEGAACLSPVTIEGLRELYLNTAEQGVTANTPGTAGRSHDAYKLAKDAGTRRWTRRPGVSTLSLSFSLSWHLSSRDHLADGARPNAARTPGTRPT